MYRKIIGSILLLILQVNMVHTGIISLTLFAGLMPYFILSSENRLNPGIPISVCAALSLLFINFKGNDYGYLRSKLSY